MRKVTVWITIVLSMLILGYSHYANLTGSNGKVGNANPSCTTTAAPTTPECQHDAKPGETK